MRQKSGRRLQKIIQLANCFNQPGYVPLVQFGRSVWLDLNWSVFFYKSSSVMLTFLWAQTFILIYSHSRLFLIFWLKKEPVTNLCILVMKEHNMGFFAPHGSQTKKQSALFHQKKWSPEENWNQALDCYLHKKNSICVQLTDIFLVSNFHSVFDFFSLL